ncbi:MAG: PepSY domain-containing protein [Erysipelotrichaceae bacterium]|nr:PepSY domain-containing protein [Erysipelotrichaceae bacterium]
MKKLKEMFAKLKSNRYFQIGAIGLAGVLLVSLLTFVPKVEQVEADAENANTTTDVMTVDEAKEVALKDANVTDATMEDVQLDYDDGVQVYDVDFTSDGIEYDYEINAQTGEIIKRETKIVATTTTTNTTTTDTTTTTSTITKDKAKSIAMNHAGVTSVSNYTIKEDTEDGAKVYEIEFTSGNYEYDYTIRVSDGKILDVDKEKVKTTTTNNTTSSTTTTSITKDKAKTIAMNHAGVTSVSNYTIKTDTEDGVKVYELEFTSGNYEYDYTIRMSDGKILDVDKEAVKTTNNSTTSSTTSSTTTTTSITKDKAKSIAMNHAGVTSVSNYTIKTDTEDGVKVYELEFTSGNYEYDYTIRMSDGKILDVDKDYVGTATITAATAKAKAFAHAGISESQATKVEVELDKGVYEVSFKYNGYEYEYEINGSDGSIINYEKELD